MKFVIRNSEFTIHNSNYKLQITLALAFAAFVLYLRTLAPDVLDADSGEFQFAAWNFGFVHPTGYPLFLILGGAFQHLVPLGNPAFRLNLFNAILAALTIGVLYLAMYAITKQRVASVIAAASFAVTRTFWYDASAVEVYALNALFITILVCIALQCQAKLSARKFAFFCFTFGLALTHHRSMLLWIPAFALFFAIVADQFRIPTKNLVRPALRFGVYFLVPFLLYLYIPLRAPASPYATLALAPGRDLVLFDNSFSGFVNYFLGRTFQGELRWDATSIVRLAALPQLFLDQFGALGVALGILGFIALLARRAWALVALTLTAFAATILFASFYHIGDIAHYYIPAYLVWTIWFGAGLAVIPDLISRTLAPHANAGVTHPASRIPQYAIYFAYLLAAACLLYQLTLNLPLADRSRETQPREQWTRLVAAPIPANAILISNDRDEMMPLWYMQYVEGARRDVLGLFPLITPDRANIAQLTDSVLDANRPIYFIKPMPGMEIKYDLQRFDYSLVQVLGAANHTPRVASNAVIGERVRVLGYDLAREGNMLRVTLYLQSRVKLASNYTAFAQLDGSRGGKIAQGNDHQVGGEFYPSSMWAVGEILRDAHTIELPPDAMPGTYRLFVGMYRQPDFDPLGDPVEVGWVDLQ
ncbi:MAG: DUF2723 domain-containing protein [Chloroflexi bacterium]|nr:DUF2723 domain-containing protein [Chloroflexota bacterium]